MTRCTHHYCRCVRAHELAQQAEATGRTDYLRQAIAVHHQEVTCRLEGPQEARGRTRPPGANPVS